MSKIGHTRLRILEVYGSEGMPSCGVSDAADIGQGIKNTYHVGGTGESIAPGTPRYLFPLSLQHLLAPEKMSKNPRNMESVKSHINRKER